MYGTFLDEPQLIAMAYDLEQALQARQQPQFLGSIIPIPNAGLCNQPHRPHGKAHLPTVRRTYPTAASSKVRTGLALSSRLSTRADR